MIKDILVSINGIFVSPRDYISPYVGDLQERVEDLNLEHSSLDRANLHNDLQNIKRDYKHAVKKYKISTRSWPDNYKRIQDKLGPNNAIYVGRSYNGWATRIRTCQAMSV